MNVISTTKTTFNIRNLGTNFHSTPFTTVKSVHQFDPNYNLKIKRIWIESCQIKFF